MEINGGVRPVSATQWRIWFDAQLQRDRSAYNAAVAYRVLAALETADLCRALEAEIASHAELHSVFRVAAGGMLTKARRAGSVRVETLGPAASDAAALEIAQRRAEEPFDPACGPLIRAVLIPFPEAALLVLACHHLVCDGESFEVLLRGTSRRITERDFVPAPPEHVYESTAALPETGPKRPSLGERTSARVALLPVDGGDGGARYGATIMIPASGAVRSTLARSARRHRVSPFALETTAFALVLAAFDPTGRIVASFPVSLRRSALAADAVGPFLAYRTIAIDADRTTSLRRYVAGVWAEIVAMIADADLEPSNDLLASNRLYHGAYSLAYVVLDGTIQLGHVVATRVQLRAQTSKFQITLALTEIDGRLDAVVQYATASYSRSAIERYVALFMRAIELIDAADDATPVARIAAALRDGDLQQVAQPADRDELLFVQRDAELALRGEEKLDAGE